VPQTQEVQVYSRGIQTEVSGEGDTKNAEEDREENQASKKKGTSVSTASDASSECKPSLLHCTRTAHLKALMIRLAGTPEEEIEEEEQEAKTAGPPPPPGSCLRRRRLPSVVLFHLLRVII